MPELRKDVLKDEAHKRDTPDELLDRFYGEHEIQTNEILYSSQVSTSGIMPACIPIRPLLNRRNAALNIYCQPSPLFEVTTCKTDSSDESTPSDETPEATGMVIQRASGPTVQDRRGESNSRGQLRVSCPPRRVFSEAKLAVVPENENIPSEPCLNPPKVACYFEGWEKVIYTQSQPADVEPLANSDSATSVNEGCSQVMSIDFLLNPAPATMPSTKADSAPAVLAPAIAPEMSMTFTGSSYGSIIPEFNGQQVPAQYGAVEDRSQPAGTTPSVSPVSDIPSKDLDSPSAILGPGITPQEAMLLTGSYEDSAVLKPRQRFMGNIPRI